MVYLFRKGPLEMGKGRVVIRDLNAIFSIKILIKKGCIFMPVIGQYGGQNFGGFMVADRSIKSSNTPRELTTIGFSPPDKTGKKELNQNLSAMNDFYGKDASGFTPVTAENNKEVDEPHYFAPEPQKRGLFSREKSGHFDDALNSLCSPGSKKGIIGATSNSAKFFGLGSYCLAGGAVEKITTSTTLGKVVGTAVGVPMAVIGGGLGLIFGTLTAPLNGHGLM